MKRTDVLVLGMWSYLFRSYDPQQYLLHDFSHPQNICVLKRCCQKYLPIVLKYSIMIWLAVPVTKFGQNNPSHKDPTLPAHMNSSFSRVGWKGSFSCPLNWPAHAAGPASVPHNAQLRLRVETSYFKQTKPLEMTLCFPQGPWKCHLCSSQMFSSIL